MYLPLKLPSWSSAPAATRLGLPGRLRQQAAYWQRVQQLGKRLPQLAGLELVAALLDCLDIRVECEATGLQQVPPAGAFLAVANQPDSLLYGLVVLHVLGRVRPELRAVLTKATGVLLAPLAANVLISQQADAPQQSVPGFRHLLRWLHHEVPLAVFPAGAGSALDFPAPVAQLLTTTALPLVPIRLGSQPAALPGWWERAYALFYQPDWLPAELLAQRGTAVRVQVGSALLPAELHRLPVAARAAHLRTHLQAAATDTETALATTTQAGAAQNLLEAELAALPLRRCVVHCPQWEVYVAKSRELPHILPELKRLRAAALSAAGAGPIATGEADLLPDCHRYLLLYDRQARQLVGGCRLGHGKRLLRQRGSRGFGLYLAYKLKRKLRPVLQQALELSQAFIRSEYQGQSRPLNLLWEGLAQYLRAHPHYRYLLGQASLPYQVLPASRAQVAGFINQHLLGHELAPQVQPRKSVRYRALTGAALPAALPADLNREQVLHSLLTGAEPGGMGVPWRLRPYFCQQAQLLGVHLDPAGSDALYGAILLDTTSLADYTCRLAGRGSGIALK